MKAQNSPRLISTSNDAGLESNFQLFKRLRGQEKSENVMLFS